MAQFIEGVSLDSKDSRTLLNIEQIISIIEPKDNGGKEITDKSVIQMIDKKIYSVESGLDDLFIALN